MRGFLQAALAGASVLLAVTGAQAQPRSQTGAPATGAVETPFGCHWVDVDRHVQHLWCPDRQGRFFDTGLAHAIDATADSTACPPGLEFDGAYCLPRGYYGR